MNPSFPVTNPPACAEDVVLTTATDGTWVCGPARDDVVLVTNVESCGYLVGQGDFSAGTWSSYYCADTADRAIPAPTAAPTAAPIVAAPTVAPVAHVAHVSVPAPVSMPDTSTSMSTDYSGIGGVLLVVAAIIAKVVNR